MQTIKLSFLSKDVSLAVAGGLGIEMNYPIIGYNETFEDVVEDVYEDVVDPITGMPVLDMETGNPVRHLVSSTTVKRLISSEPIYDTTKPNPPADGEIPPMPPLWTAPVYYNAMAWTPMDPTGETDPKTGASIMVPRPGFHIFAQLNSDGELNFPPDLLQFIDPDPNNTWQIQWG